MPVESILGEAWVAIQANVEPALKQVSTFMDKVASTELIMTTRADISRVVRSYDQVKQMARDAKPIITLDLDGTPWFVCSQGNSFNIVNSGSVQVSGTIYYTLSTVNGP